MGLLDRLFGRRPAPTKRAKAPRRSVRDTRAEDGARDELREKAGGTQVPCLFIDGVALLESADINRWLSAYSERSAAPA